MGPDEQSGLEAGLRSTPWLRHAAVTSAGRLGVQSPEVTRALIQEVARRVAVGEIRDRRLLSAEIRRFPDPAPILRALRYLILAPLLCGSAIGVSLVFLPRTSKNLAWFTAGFLSVIITIWLFAAQSVFSAVSSRSRTKGWVENADYLMRYVALGLLFLLSLSAIEALGSQHLIQAAIYGTLFVYGVSLIPIGIGAFSLPTSASFVSIPSYAARFLLGSIAREGMLVSVGIGLMLYLANRVFSDNPGVSVITALSAGLWTMFLGYLVMESGVSWARERYHFRRVAFLFSDTRPVSSDELAAAFGSVKRPYSVSIWIRLLREGDRLLGPDAIDFLEGLARARTLEAASRRWLIDELSDADSPIATSAFPDEGFRIWLGSVLSRIRRWLLDLDDAFDDEVGRLVLDVRYRVG